MTFKNILCPLDFSENMDKVINIAVKLAEDGASITLFHHSVLITPMSPADAAIVFEADQDAKEYSAKHLEELAEKLNAKNPKINFATHHSYLKSITDEINDLVKKNKIDLIVMGSHGRTGLSRLFMGSVAEDIFRNASCPVFMVKLK
jgi:universal stress protein A